MPEDKLIKSGQFTAKRLLFLIVSGGVLVVVVASGHLNLGYMLLTAVLCVLLFLIALDYGVNMEKVEFGSATAQPNPNLVPTVDPDRQAALSREARGRKRTGKQPKRRR